MQSNGNSLTPASADQLSQIDQLFKDIGQFYPIAKQSLTRGEADEIIGEAKRQLQRNRQNYAVKDGTSGNRRYNMGLLNNVETYLSYAVSTVGILVSLAAIVFSGVFAAAYLLKWQDDIPVAQPIICGIIFVVGLTILVRSVRRFSKTRRAARISDVNSDGSRLDKMLASPTMVSLIDNSFRSLGLSYDFSSSHLTLAEARELLDEAYDLSDATKHRWQPKSYRINPLTEIKTTLHGIFLTITEQGGGASFLSVFIIASIACGWIAMAILIAFQNIFLSIGAIILMVIIVLALHNADTDYDGYMNDHQSATPEQLVLLEYGYRMVGRNYHKGQKTTKGGVRHQLTAIYQTLSRR